MRLRWLHLPHCGPLQDLAVRFGQEGMLYGWSDSSSAKRKGAINFVVGVNGTGKSSLLRAIYRSFRALSIGSPPPLPITLAWDRLIGTEAVTAIFHMDAQALERTFFTALARLPDTLDEAQWQARIARIAEGTGDFQETRVERGSDAWMGSYLQAHSPRPLIGYTSGAELLWAELEQRSLRPDWDVPTDTANPEERERPPGWSIEREWTEQVPARMSLAASGYVSNTPYKPPPLPLVDDFRSPDWEQRIIDSQRSAAYTQAKLAATRRRNPVGDPVKASRVRQSDLRLAAIALALWQAARELHSRRTELDQAALRRDCIAAPAGSGDPARRVLNQLDWFLPTHLSLVYRADDDQIDDTQRDRFGCLLGLADTVVAQPLGRLRTVISLGPRGFDSIKTDLDARFPSAFVGTSREPILDRIEGCASGAEAVIRVFSDAKAPDATGADALEPTLIEVFETLRAWQAAGLLEEVNLTIKRLHQINASDGEPDDAIITFDQLSDGEQMLLGRVALLHLVRGQDGALLLLDEPETHFNDVWKRELIDMIDDVILKETFAQVLVSTHTSIALTDVFSSEVVRLSWRDDRIVAESPAFPTFGADPGRILMHVFGSPEIIGRRAAEFLREKLKQEWTADNRDELARLVEEIGAGWPRAKPTEILLRLDASSGS
ncbi:MAG TPA: AAA family ATPase [Lamprocystis sp. (in: g-proteobacteria)]|nr:AAA family ATPase [Lamprocystis sp. (in: g-proteobacteria)]